MPLNPHALVHTTVRKFQVYTGWVVYKPVYRNTRKFQVNDLAAAAEQGFVNEVGNYTSLLHYPIEGVYHTSHSLGSLRHGRIYVINRNTPNGPT